MSQSSKEVRELFDAYAKEYDSGYLEHPLLFESEARAINALGLRGMVLEVGVGSGAFASRLKIDVGVDLSFNMLLSAKRREREGEEEAGGGVAVVVQAAANYLPAVSKRSV